MSRRNCTSHPDSFCYICGKYTPTIQQKNLTKSVKTAYKHYFKCQVGDQDKNWAPHFRCITCSSTLIMWMNGKRKQMTFGVPMIWREQVDHYSDCYFCMTQLTGFSRKNKSKIVYPDCRSALKPVAHCLEIPVPNPPSNSEFEKYQSSESSAETSEDDAYLPAADEKTPHLLNQLELNDLVRDLSLPKEKVELLSSRLQQWNLLEKGTKVTNYRDRSAKLSSFYKFMDGVCYCPNATALMEELGAKHDAENWRLFIDSSKTSLKAVLLHNGNTKPSIPLAHAVGMKETYDSMKRILELIHYENYKWKICGDLKVISLVLGLQLGYTKHMCFLCLWNSRDDRNHFFVKKWPSRVDHEVGRYNVQHMPLVDPKKVCLPPLHIKLGLIKNFVKAMNVEGNGFKYLQKMFCPAKSDAKLKAGIFIGPEIRRLIKDSDFKNHLNHLELPAWESFVKVVENFLGNHRNDNYQELVDNLLSASGGFRGGGGWGGCIPPHQPKTNDFGRKISLCFE